MSTGFSLIGGVSSVQNGLSVSYTNSNSGLKATNTQNAIDELADVKVLKKQAGESIISYKAVIVENDTVFYFDPTNPDHYGKCVGISRNGCLENEACEIVTGGIINTGIPLVSGSTYYVDADKNITHVVPVNVSVFQSIGIAISSTLLVVNIYQSIQK